MYEICAARIFSISYEQKGQYVHILRRNCLHCDAFEGHLMEVKGVGIKRTSSFDDLRNRRRYLGAKECEGKRKKRWKRQFSTGG